MDLITNSGPMVLMVLLILFVLSIISWSIIIFKFKVVRKANKDSIIFLSRFWRNKEVSSTFIETRGLPYSPIARVFRAGYQEFEKVKKKKMGGSNPSQVPSGAADSFGGRGIEIENISRALTRAANYETNRLEKSLSFLATTGNTAPFIGLLGTVWGIMNTFRQIGLKGSTSLVVVAPGISEALIATAAGLFVAIPAVVFYNYYINKIRILNAEMDNFAAEFLNIIARNF